MAGDWIPRDKRLSRKLEVIRIAGIMKMHRRQVAATLEDFWSWADDETEDGFLPGIHVPDLSLFIEDTTPEFWHAVASVGWIIERSDGIEIANYDHWLSFNAKKRLKEARKKRYQRRKPTLRPAPVPVQVGQSRDRTGDKQGTTGQYSTVQRKDTPKAPSKTATSFDPAAAPMPPQLGGDAFRETWKRWCVFRSEVKKKLTPSMVEGQLKKLAAWGEAKATAAIEKSITNGWMGLFEPEGNTHGHGTGLGQHSRVVTPDGKYDDFGTTINCDPPPDGQPASGKGSAPAGDVPPR